MCVCVCVCVCKSILYIGAVGIKRNKAKGRRRPRANFFISRSGENGNEPRYFCLNSYGSTLIFITAIKPCVHIRELSFSFFFFFIASLSLLIRLVLFALRYRVHRCPFLSFPWLIYYFFSGLRMLCIARKLSDLEVKFISVLFRCALCSFCRFLECCYYPTGLEVVTVSSRFVFLISSTEDDQRVRSLTASWQ